MGSLNLDQNAWYQINVTRQSGQSLVGTPLYTNNGTQGAVFYQITNTSSPMQSWQFWPYNSSVYLLRCRDSGPNSYLAASSLGGGDGDPAGHVIGDSVPVMNSYKNTDASMFWVAAPWGDGTYYLYNLANGSNWRINVLSSSLMTMDSDITAPQVGEQFVFSPLRAINDNRYSTYHVGDSQISDSSHVERSRLTMCRRYSQPVRQQHRPRARVPHKLGRPRPRHRRAPRRQLPAVCRRPWLLESASPPG